MKIQLRSGKWKGIDKILKIPEISFYSYLGIRIDQSLTMKYHSERLKTAEKEMRKRIGILKPSLLSTKNRLIVFKSIINSKYWYAAAIICYHIPKYIGKLEAMLYSLLKQLFHIRANINKKILLKTLNIEDTASYVNWTINRINNIPQLKTETDKSLIELLSNKAIKLKLSWLFFSRSRNKYWNCACHIDNEHVIKDCPLASEWRKKWNIITKSAEEENIYSTLTKEHKDPTNFETIANIINEATEELVNIYFSKQLKPEDYLI